MARRHITLWAVTLLNVTAAAVTLGSLIYIQGVADGHSKVTEPVYVESPKQVVANPHVGQGLHPSFDCSSLSRAVNSTFAGQITIGALAKDTNSYANQPIGVRKVMAQAFPKINGTNWFHFCDRPNGQVLVASSRQWADPGSEIVITATRSVNPNIGGAYLFPRLIEDANLDGPQGKEPKNEQPKPIDYR